MTMRKRSALLGGSSVDSLAMAGGHDAVAARRQADGSLRPVERQPAPAAIGSISGYMDRRDFNETERSMSRADAKTHWHERTGK